MEGKQLYKENCTVLQQQNNVALVLAGNEKIVAKTNKKINIGDNVNLYKIPFIPKILECLIYFIPVFSFFLGFGFGFFFKEELYHFLLVIGTTIFGFAILILIKVFISKIPENKYFIEKENKLEMEDNYENSSK